MGLRHAIDCAVWQCMDEGVLLSFLKEVGPSAKDLLYFDYAVATEKRRLYAAEIQYGLEQGLEQGRREGREPILARVQEKIAEGNLTLEDALDLGFTREELESLS